MANLSEGRKRLLLAGLGGVCFVLLLALEILTEDDELSLLDIAIDGLGILLTIGAAVGVALLAARVESQHEEKMALIRDLEFARAEGNAWRNKVRSHLAGLKAGMDLQFQDWGMTAAEREISLLILKGLSHKEIAVLRATTEPTVRQQAQSIYRKAKLPGKTAFCAYFLEDLFAEQDEGAEAVPSPSRKAASALEPRPGAQPGSH